MVTTSKIRTLIEIWAMSGKSTFPIFLSAWLSSKQKYYPKDPLLNDTCIFTMSATNFGIYRSRDVYVCVVGVHLLLTGANNNRKQIWL